MYKIVFKKFGISKNILYLCIIIIEPEGIEINKGIEILLSKFILFNRTIRNSKFQKKSKKFTGKKQDQELKNWPFFCLFNIMQIIGQKTFVNV